MYKRIRNDFGARMIFLKNANEKVVLFICLLAMRNQKTKKHQHKFKITNSAFTVYHENKMQVRKSTRL